MDRPTPSNPPSVWLFSLASCTPLGTCLRADPRGYDETRRLVVIQEPPSYQLRPLAVPQAEPPEADAEDEMLGRNAQKNRSGRKRFWTDASSRRPRISGPSNFRHLQSGTFPAPRGSTSWMLDESEWRLQGGDSFRPLELSMHMPDNLAEIRPLTPPPPAYFASRTDEDQGLTRQRSYSSMSFHVPRRPVAGSSPCTTRDSLPPQIPPRAEGRRARAHTEPDVEMIKERVASAMIELDRLQKQIDDVIDRQSIYINSRPSTPRSRAQTMPELEAMPCVPVLPPAAPSFAERLNWGLDRPQTAPMETGSPTPMAVVRRVAGEGYGRPGVLASRVDLPLAPPLPLVLRPPLRKKKSFSQVSGWLFPGPEQGGANAESAKEVLEPREERDVLYQCANETELSGRRSYESLDSASARDSDEEQHTAPKAWSPGSTPVVQKQEGSTSPAAAAAAEEEEEEEEEERSAALGKNSGGRSAGSSVGVAL